MKQNEQARSTTQSLYSSPQDRQTVLQCTEQITRTIQQLCKSIQEPDKEDCVASAEKVKYSIGKLASHLPKVIRNIFYIKLLSIINPLFNLSSLFSYLQDTEAGRVKLMQDVASQLQPECSALQLAEKKGDAKAVESHFSNIRDLAFHLAKFTKDIVTMYSSSQ